MLILHDYMQHTDGGSRLCLELGRAFDADLLCGFIRAGHPFFAEGYAGQVRTLMPAIPVPLLRQWALVMAFERRAGDIQRYAHAVYSGSYAPLAVRHRTGLSNICYCHTPPRFLYDQREFFLAGIAAPLRPMLAAFCQWFEPRYVQAMADMTCIVTNSTAVRERIKTFLQREALVVPPPCAVEAFYWRPAAGYYLSMVRLDGLKRVELLVRAFKAMPNTKLVIASDGPAAGSLRRLAAGADNIIFAGTLAEPALRETLAGAIATLCVARDEDFGMCAVESLAAGKPVIIAQAGGLAEIVCHGETGLCLPADPEPHNIIEAVQAMTPAKAQAMRLACEERASGYALSRFVAAMRALMV